MIAPMAPVLVLEDSDEDFDTVVEAARRAGVSHPLFRATTGDECLAILRSAAAAPVLPAVLLLDLNTPGLDGREALASIRADAELRELPVVVLSTSANPRDVDLCYSAGANAYHVKPVRHSEHIQLLLDVFDYWLTRVTLPDLKRVTR